MEVLAILIFDGLVERHKTNKDVYRHIKREYGNCFNLPTYQNFQAQCLKLKPTLEELLKFILKSGRIAFLDSTPLEVCRPIRARKYKTLTRRSTGFTKNLMGWFFRLQTASVSQQKGTDKRILSVKS